MKKLNITKDKFNTSKYFQTKYGKLEYVSESGKIYKTSKGHLVKFVKESNDSSKMIIEEDKNSDVNKLIEQYLDNNLDSEGRLGINAPYDDEIIRKGTKILSQMSIEKLNSFLVDYTTHLIDDTEVDLDSNDSIKEWRKHVYPPLTTLWYMVFDILKERGLLLKDFISPDAGFAPECLMDYVETIGGYSFKKVRWIDNHYKVRIPSRDTIVRYLRSGHRFAEN